MIYTKQRTALSLEVEAGRSSKKPIEFHLRKTDDAPVRSRFVYDDAHIMKKGNFKTEFGVCVNRLFTVDMITTCDWLDLSNFKTEYFLLIQLDSSPIDVPVCQLLSYFSSNYATFFTSNTAFDRSNPVFLSYGGRTYEVVPTGLSEDAPTLYYPDVMIFVDMIATEEGRARVNCDKCNYPGCPKELSNCMLKTRLANYKPIFGDI